MILIDKKAFSLAELLVVLVILGLLAAAGIPLFKTKILRSRGERAITNIRIIASALQLYGIKYQQEIGALANLSDINNALNLELADPYFTYEIDLMTPGGGVDDYNEIVAKGIVSEIGTSDTLGYLIDCVDGDIDSYGGDRWDPSSSWPWIPWG